MPFDIYFMPRDNNGPVAMMQPRDARLLPGKGARSPGLPAIDDRKHEADGSRSQDGRDDGLDARQGRPALGARRVAEEALDENPRAVRVHARPGPHVAGHEHLVSVHRKPRLAESDRRDGRRHRQEARRAQRRLRLLSRSWILRRRILQFVLCREGLEGHGRAAQREVRRRGLHVQSSGPHARRDGHFVPVHQERKGPAAFRRAGPVSDEAEVLGRLQSRATIRWWPAPIMPTGKDIGTGTSTPCGRSSNTRPSSTIRG